MPATRPAPPAAARASGSGPQRALDKLGLKRDIELALHLPLRYEDETRLVPIGALRDGQVAQVEGVVRELLVESRPRRQLVARLRDGSGELVLRLLNFYPSQLKSLAAGTRLRVRGEARGGFFGLEMVHPALRPVDEGAPLPTALTPVYPTTAQLPQAYLRKAIASALHRAPLGELLPASVVPQGLPPLREALEWLHHPPPSAALATLEDRSHPAWQRLKFEELLAQQLAQAQARQQRARLAAPALSTQPGGLHERLLAALPFLLTAAQRRVAEEIVRDLGRAQPMHRLLQGDVGSGKTVVAALAAAVAIDTGWFFDDTATTEILAEQHFRKLVHWLEPLGIVVAWLTGTRKGRARAATAAKVASGEAALVVGTHAVIQQDVQFARLGLAIVDEQHRFGVEQRLALRAKLEPGSIEPHLLMMSATPIPRTLAMSYFADLDVSTIDELPPGRTPVLTRLFAESRRDQVIARVADEIAQGRQVYWVCPLIEESEKLDLRNAVETHQRLADALPDQRVGLLHGRMRSVDKTAVMDGFTSGEMALLVATTVIEVGVDVPNASLMVIEHAERFGLAQLHQLRGRVGRGSAASVCVLLYGPALSAAGKERLRAMLDTQDGFEIARRDLEIRGPGEFLGARQSGDALLRFADLAEDAALLRQARALATQLLSEHPDAARAHVERWLAGRAEYLKA